uniref:HSF-type DNA-binding domain-containing protein n=1 Tax=Corethron hystrix TaxID=216773 RepID=A0A7S1FS67_9STRA|mmetsp:Transcript_2471/g.4747  ORF Transcript_2471/g.4747 Transcript_2471/m.4747 type:complete len:325 (+) Transcript_2471:260-1234(+)
MSSNISKRLTFIAGENSLQNDTAAVASACENKENSSARFPDKLHTILTDKKWNHIITFTGDGRSWKVLNKKLLETEILPIYFRTKKYISFTRNVVGWGFKREGKAHYYHKLFHRDRPEQCIDMIRISASKSALINKLELQESLGSASQSSTLEPGPGQLSARFAGINKNSCNQYDPRMLGGFPFTSAFPPLLSQTKYRFLGSYPSQDINPNITLPSISCNHHAINLSTTLMQQNKLGPSSLLPNGMYAHLTEHDLNSRVIEKHSNLHGDQQNPLNNNSLQYIANHHNLLPTRESYLNQVEFNSILQNGHNSYSKFGQERNYQNW